MSFMGRVINTETAGKERSRLTRSVVLALRELTYQSEPNNQACDLIAFIAIVLELIYNTIDTTVTAWEKRDYWVKADRFRMEWAWTKKYGETMRQALQAEDWATIAQTAAQIAQKLNHVVVPLHHRLGTPWVGAWEVFKEQS